MLAFLQEDAFSGVIESLLLFLKNRTYVHSVCSPGVTYRCYTHLRLDILLLQVIPCISEGKYFLCARKEIHYFGSLYAKAEFSVPCRRPQLTPFFFMQAFSQFCIQVFPPPYLTISQLAHGNSFPSWVC